MKPNRHNKKEGLKASKPITEDNEGVIPNGPVLAWEHMIHTLIATHKLTHRNAIEIMNGLCVKSLCAISVCILF